MFTNTATTELRQSDVFLVKYAIDLPIPPFHRASANMIVDWAIMAEEVGWDAFCLWNHFIFDDPPGTSQTFDPYTLYGAIAARTKSILLGPAHSAIGRQRPWRIARTMATLDHISGGRMILGAVLGTYMDYRYFGEDENQKICAEKLDEGLDIITKFWTGKPFSHNGAHYNVSELGFEPAPVQKPRIPIWVGGSWPNRAPYRRAAKWDGVMPTAIWPKQLTPQELLESLQLIESLRGNLKDFEVIVGGRTTGSDAKKDEETITQWAEAGATWWSEGINAWRGKRGELEERIRLGPPEV